MSDHRSEPNVTDPYAKGGVLDDEFDDGYGYDPEIEADPADIHRDEYPDYYDDDGYDQDLAKLRPGEEVEGRTSWIYLGVLGAVFLLLVGFSWACDDRSSNDTGEGPAMTPDEVEGRPVRLSISIDAEVVVLSGNVPDEAARGQIITAAQAQYGSENVVDELEISEDSQLDGGTVSISGRAEFDDPRPENLRTAIVSDFGLEEANFSVDRGEAALVPTDIEAQVDGTSVRLVGTVPDQGSIDELTQATESIWGEGNVDNSGLVVGDATWADGSVRVTGAAAVGGTGFDTYPGAVQARFGPSVTVDVSALGVDLSADSLEPIEEQINTDLQTQPILFAPESTVIQEESDAILIQIAETLNGIPQVEVEVVGHTDNFGNADENQALSERRAEAVIERLVELGVDQSRLNARGEGDAVPIADNSTSDGRAQNRRIEFALVAG